MNSLLYKLSPGNILDGVMDKFANLKMFLNERWANTGNTASHTRFQYLTAIPYASVMKQSK